jgi:hypothetical protein
MAAAEDSSSSIPGEDMDICTSSSVTMSISTCVYIGVAGVGVDDNVRETSMAFRAWIGDGDVGRGLGRGAGPWGGGAAETLVV